MPTNGAFTPDAINLVSMLMRTDLIDKGLITEQGEIILRDVRGEITGHGKNVITGK